MKELSANETLAHYRIISKLGAGGMGEVYLAQDTKLNRRIALKTLRSASFGFDSKHLQRFVREAQAASALNHPNICTIYEIGEDFDVPYIAMEYVNGKTLKTIIESGLTVFQTLDFAVQIADALAEAHLHHIVHRDVKPANIIVNHRGQIKILDFGLAKKIVSGSEAETEQLLSQIGVVLGTAAYMSPEQARGYTVDARSDVWSFGVVLYEMLTGTLPFEGETPTDLLAAILRNEPSEPRELNPNVPVELERIVLKMLAKPRDERYQTAEEALVDLLALKNQVIGEARSGELELLLPARNTRQNELNAQSSSAPNPATATNNGTHTTSSAEYIVTQVKKRKATVLGVLAFLLAAIFLVGYLAVFPRRSRAINSVAVLPFVNGSSNAELEYLSDGLSESLIDRLSQLPQLKVTARSSAFKYKNVDLDLREAADSLDVTAIVTGRVVQRGEQLLVRVELVDARDNKQLWGATFNRRAAEFQAVAEEIAHTLGEKLRLRLSGTQEEQLTKNATANAQAYQLYLNAVFYRRKGGVENVRRALTYYAQALALDPNFALAHAGTAEAYYNLLRNGFLDPKETMPKAVAAVERALELDDTLAEAHLTLTSIKKIQWEWAAAERGYRRVIELNPSLAAARVGYANFLIVHERHGEALAEIKRAQELDPLSQNLKVEEKAILYFARRYDEAIRGLREIIKAEPDNFFAHTYLGYALAAKGQYAEAVAEYRKDTSVTVESPSALIYVGAAFARSNRRDEALVILNTLETTAEYVSPAELAILQTALGNREAAFEVLERAFAARDLQLMFLKVEPGYDDLRADSRFNDLVRRVGLPE